MENKIWILRDSDGNLPTADEAEQFRKWLRRDDYAPEVRCKEGYDDNGETIRCEWEFKAKEIGARIVTLSADNASLRRWNNHHVSLLEQIKLAVAARDIQTARRLLGLRD